MSDIVEEANQATPKQQILDPDRLMIDPPSGWQYGFPKFIPREHLHRATEWMIENGYPRKLTEGKRFPVRIGITLDGKRIDPQDFYLPPAPQKEKVVADCEQCAALRAEVVQASQQLGDILAIIHRDGGHHTADVGIEQSVKDAHIKWANLMTENEELRAALDLYREAVRIDVTMEGPKFMGLNGSALKRAWDADRAALEEK